MKDIKEIEKLLKPWVKAFQEIEESYKGIEKIFGVADPDSKIFKPMYNCHESYTNALAELLNCSAEYTLNWFLWDNNCGKNKLEARAKMKPICNIKDLARLIASGE